MNSNAGIVFITEWLFFLKKLGILFLISHFCVICDYPPKEVVMQNIAIGIQNFSILRENGYFYIDKTGFIKEWWESGDEVTLIARPRRFGKTLNMSMLEHFFSVKHAGRGNLFEGLSIWKDEKYRQLQGTYPVISVSFAGIKECDFAGAMLRMNQLLVNLYSEHEFLLESDKLTTADKEFFKRVSMNMVGTDASFALHQLSKFMYQYYGKRVIILLDEYDTPLQEAFVHGFWQELVAFMRSMFNVTFKTNPYLYRAVMTGITRVSKESIFSDLNNLKVVTVSSDEYATAFGFTEKEVYTALEESGLEDLMEEAKYWYDGFVFGTYTDVYNPWSILNLLDTGKVASYWANTSSNGLVSHLLRSGDRRIKQSFEKLLQGEVIRKPVDEQIVYNNLDGNETAVWSLLLASGYLKVLALESYDEEKVRILYDLALTNREVKNMFYDMVQRWFGSSEGDYNDFVEAMLQDDVEAMNTYMNGIIKAVFSYFDTGAEASAPERFYHGFVLGLLVELHGKYVLTSNRESGFGRYDVMLEPLDKSKNAMILEFKVRSLRREASLEDTLDSALKQIEEKQYETALLAKGVPAERIKKYGFAFEGKKVLIGSPDFQW